MVIPLTDLMNPYCRLLPKDVDVVVTIQVVVVMMVVVDVEEVIDLRGHLVLVMPLEHQDLMDHRLLVLVLVNQARDSWVVVDQEDLVDLLS